MAKLSPTKHAEVDFDYLMNLAKNDPEGFKVKREEMIEEYINSVPPKQQHRLRCVQWRIDQARAKAKSPLGACMAITEMMWDSFEQLNQLFLDMRNDSQNNGPANRKVPETADILPFRIA